MQKLTIALGIWAAIGPLLGVFVGHLLTRSWQREQARLDNIKAEYRELLSALADAYTTFTRLGPRDEEPRLSATPSTKREPRRCG